MAGPGSFPPRIASIADSWPLSIATRISGLCLGIARMIIRTARQRVTITTIVLLRVSLICAVLSFAERCVFVRSVVPSIKRHHCVKLTCSTDRFSCRPRAICARPRDGSGLRPGTAFAHEGGPRRTGLFRWSRYGMANTAPKRARQAQKSPPCQERLICLGRRCDGNSSPARPPPRLSPATA